MQPALTMIPLIALVVFPIFDSMIFISGSLIKSLHSLTVATYYSLAMNVTFIPLTFIQCENTFALLGSFLALDWTMLCVVSAISASISFMLHHAMKYKEPAKLALVDFFQAVFQLGFDVLVFHS